MTTKRKKNPGGRPHGAGLTTPFGRMIEALGLSGKMVADELGVTRQYVSMLMSGKHAPSTELREQIAEWARSKGKRCAASTWDPYMKRAGHVGRPRLSERAS